MLPPVTPPFPTGPFDLLLADPPWRFKAGRSSRSVENHYPTMPLAAIAALPVCELMARDSALVMWTTSPMLEQSLQVVRAWGCRFKTTGVWKKLGAPGLGFYFRQDHELLLLATRGKGLGAPPPALRVSSVIEAKKGRHSEKPVRLHEILESWWPDARRLELFARATRPGWTAWGNEIPAVTVSPSGLALAA